MKAKYQFLLLMLLVFFYFSSTIDVKISELFYNYSTQKFYGEDNALCLFIYKLVNYLVLGVIVYSLLHYKKNKYFSLMIILALIAGPGLLVNTVFKNHWGRPRPYQVLRDKQQFSPIYNANFNKNYNNSMPSGHSSIGYFMGVPFILQQRRKLGYAIGIISGLLIGFIRILQGGHYLSDVICAGIFVFIVAELVLYIFKKYFNYENYYK